MEPLTRLFETPPLPGSDLRAGLPADLARAYAGELAIPLRKDRPTVIANFVQTIDGAVALALPAERAPWAELLSVRLGGHHLFLRYRFEEVVR